MVWLDGKRVDDGSSYPAFLERINELAHIYDFKRREEFQDVTTFP